MIKSPNRYQMVVNIICVLSLLLSSIHFPAQTPNAEVAAQETETTRSNHNSQIIVPAPSNLHVNSWNGNLFHPVPLLTIPNRGIPIDLALSYNSSWHEVATHFGYGWQLNYNMFYVREESGDITIVWHDGRTDTYRKNNGRFDPPVDVYDNLIEYAPGKYWLRAKEGLLYYFDSAIHKRLTRLQDPNGNGLNFAYDANLRLTTITDDSGRQLELEYDDAHLSRIVDNNSSPQRTIDLAYDSEGNLTAVTDPKKNTTTFGYDGGHLLTAVTDPRDNTATIDYHENIVINISQGDTSKSFTYNADNYTTTMADSVDEGDRITHFVYDDQGRIQQIQREKDAQGSTATQQFVWDDNNNLTRFTDGNNEATAYTYDERGNLLTLTDPLGQTTTYTYEATYNKITTVSDANGQLTTYTYDTTGNLTQIADPLNNITQFAHALNGDLESVTDANNHTISYSYNSYGNLLSITDPLAHTVIFTYDNVGNRLTTTDANSHTTTFTYDANNNLATITNPLGQETNYIYDANDNLLRTTDALNNSTRYQYDTLNRLTQVTDALNNITRYGYDNQSNLRTLQDANGNTTIFSYDRLDRLIAETDPLGNATSYTFDDIGNILTRTDANGDTTSYTYDAANRLLTIDYPDTNDVGYTYDAVGNVTSMENADVAVVQTYDALNRLSSVTTTTNGFDKTVSYTYDAVGNQATMTDPDNGVTTYTYDAADRLISLINPSLEETTFAYDNGDLLTQKTLANGTYATYSYDAANQLLLLSHHNSADAVLMSFAYTYDDVGNRLTMTEANDDRTSYNYDALYQLTHVTYPNSNSTSYAYDPVGNRLTHTDANGTTTYSYDASNRLLAAGTTTYGWDNNGNQTSKTENGSTTIYTYDFENRLIQVGLPNTMANVFEYYPSGLRLNSINVESNQTFYFYDGINVLIETDPSANTQKYYTSSNVDDWVSVKLGGESYFFHQDGLNSTVSLSDVNQQTISSYKYDAFGRVWAQEGMNFNKHLYTGRRLDEEIELYYYRARHYELANGRFLQPDPLGYSWALNLYTYVDNNPVIALDPTGKITFPFTEKHRNRNANNLGPAGDLTHVHNDTYVDDRGREWTLRPESTSKFHGEGNLVFNSESHDGKGSYEIVLEPTGNGTWQQVTTGPFQQTYNHHDHNKHPIKHVFDDVLPHIFDKNYSDYSGSAGGSTSINGGAGGSGGGHTSGGYSGGGGGYSGGGGGGTGGGGGGGGESRPLLAPASSFLGVVDLPSLVETLPPADPLVELEDVFPAEGPANTTYTPAPPSFPLGGATNAVDAAAVDFVAVDDTVKATVFATKTIEKPYEHDYGVCNRFQNYDLESLAPLPLPHIIPEATTTPWFWYASATKDALVEETFVFTVFVNDSDKIFTVDSYWLGDSYTPPADLDYDYLFNFQIWASDAGESYGLLQRTLAGLTTFDGGSWSVDFINTEEPQAPTVVFKSAQVLGDKIEVTVQSWLTETQTVHFYGGYRLPTDTTTNVEFDEEIVIDPGHNTFELIFGTILDGVIFVNADGFLDKVYVGSGFWFAFDDSAEPWSPSEVVLEDAGCNELTGLGDNALAVPGCGQMNGRISDQNGYIGMGVSINPNGRPIDVSQHAALTFWARGDGRAYRLKMESDSVQDADFHEFVFIAPAEWQQFIVPLSAFRQRWENNPVPFTGTDVKALIWVAEGIHPTNDVALQVDRVAFFSSAVIEDVVGPMNSNDANGPYEITAVIRDDDTITDATLAYSLDGNQSFTTVPMTSVGNDQFQAEIPGKSMGQEVSYYLTATDNEGNVALHPPNAPYTTRHFRIEWYPSRLVDNFFDAATPNLLGGDSGLTGELSEGTAVYENGTLRLDYTTTTAQSYLVYFTLLRNLDATTYRSLSFRIKGANGGEKLAIGLNDGQGHEPKIAISEHLPAGVTTSWQTVMLPLDAFTNEIANWDALHSLSIAFEERINSGTGTVWIDDIRFEPAADPLSLDNYNDRDTFNGIGLNHSHDTGGSGSLASSYSQINAYSGSGASLTLEYNVPSDASYAAWQSGLALDVSVYDKLSLAVRGAHGGETAHVWLASGGVARWVELSDFVPITTDWQVIEIPLQAFADQGVDLTQLTLLKIAFEWVPMNGTLHVDNIHFTLPPSPNITAVSPQTIDNDAAATITITGENFLMTPTIALGATPLDNVVREDEGKITAVVPAGFAGGLYHLHLIQPNLQSDAVLEAITVNVVITPTPTATVTMTPTATATPTATPTITATPSMTAFEHYIYLPVLKRN